MMHKTRLTSPKFTRSGLLRYFLKGSLHIFIAVIVCGLFVTLFSTVIPKIIGFVIDSVIGDEPVPDMFQGAVAGLGGVERLRRDLWVVALIVVAIAACAFIFHYLRIYLTSVANQTFVRRMRDECFSQIQRLPLEWHSAHRTGDIIQRCTTDIDAISNFISQQLLTLFRLLLSIVVSVAFMFTIDVKLAAIALAFVPVLLGGSLLFYKYAGPRFQKFDEEEGVLSAIAQENLTGVRVVRAFGMERRERDKFEKQNQKYTLMWVRLEKVMAFYWTASDFIAALQLLFLVVFGTVFCVNGQTTAGNLVAFISYNGMMMGPVRQLGRVISNLSKASVALGRIAEIMNGEPEDYGNAGGLSGDIAFDDVSFGYGGSETEALKGVSFTVPMGSTLGIVGGTGSGKSTIALLLDRLYEPTGGKITIGGVDLNTIDRATVRANIGLILQESYIYSRTVGQNVSIAASGATREDIEGVCKLSCLDENIADFSSGYDTMVGERGVTLSGGQRQRLAIARTLIRNTPYLIFDDSLSAVDSDTDLNIRRNLKSAQNNATTIIISHRMATVMNADNIIVLDGGKITVRGTHDELMALGGTYRRIYDMQTAEVLDEGGANEK